MVVDDYGVVGYTQEEVLNYLRINPNFDITGLHLTDGESYKKGCEESYLEMQQISIWDERSYALSPEEYHKELQQIWLMPDQFSNLDIEDLLRSKCHSPEQLQRVNEELILYKQHNLLDLLKYLNYLKATADQNNIVWGVGRGSSCCSYCLYLLGIHRVDSVKYKLDIHEFLRD